MKLQRDRNRRQLLGWPSCDPSIRHEFERWVRMHSHGEVSIMFFDSHARAFAEHLVAEGRADEIPVGLLEGNDRRRWINVQEPIEELEIDLGYGPGYGPGNWRTPETDRGEDLQIEIWLGEVVSAIFNWPPERHSPTLSFHGRHGLERIQWGAGGPLGCGRHEWWRYADPGPEEA